MGLYQDPEASNIQAQRAGNKAGCLHRRHSADGKLRSASQ